MLTKTRIIPVGLVGARLIPTYGAGAEPSEESPTPFYFNYPTSTFTAGMAKRNSGGPFAAGVLAQGKRDTTGTGDWLYGPSVTLVAPSFWTILDSRQCTIVFWITPEWNGNDGLLHYILSDSSYATVAVRKTAANNMEFSFCGGFISVSASAAAMVAGTTYCVVMRASSLNPIDGTNYGCVSINDVHTFGDTGIGTLPTGLGQLRFLCTGPGENSADALIEGFTIYRRVLWDGSYGVNVGNGDELALIYAAGAGADPCTITGSWDVCLCVPTNSTPGALVTGTGEAWSHPHSSNLLTDGWLQSYYGGGQWGVKLTDNTSYINCGSGATLDDLCAGGAIMQVEGWFKTSYTGSQVIISKGNLSNAGWALVTAAAGTTYFRVYVNGVSVQSTAALDTKDGKWHHVVCHYNDTTKISQIAVDGIWYAASGAGAGAYSSDAALSLLIGRETGGVYPMSGGVLGWWAIHNDAHYTPGTNFKPDRTPPAADVEQWLLNEGTGVTATAQVTSPANDGTITAGTWQPQWYAEGTPIVPTSVQGSASYRATITAAATINDLADNAFTIEGWFRIPKTGVNQFYCYKGNTASTGWYIVNAINGTIQARIWCANTSGQSATTARWDDNRWHYIKVTFDDAGDRKPYIYVDNVLVAQGQIAGVGAIVTDVASNGVISDAAVGITGAHGWIAWSNVVRGAGMISRYAGRAVDGNTVVQFEATTGFGASLIDTSGNANHGAMAGTFSWVNTGAMDVDSPGGRVFGWGDAVGSDAVSEGKKITFTGLTAGANYVLRALPYSEDGVGIPRVEVYDETNAAAITAITGLATSTEWTPDVLLFSFELPTNARGAAADCTSISIKRISTTAGNVGWHQIELYANLLDNPSLDTGAGDPFIPYGWTNVGLDAGDTEVEAVIRHSEGACIQANAGATGEWITQAPAPYVTGKFYSLGFWCYNSATISGETIGASSVNAAAKQNSITTQFEFGLSTDTTWKKLMAVGRGGATGGGGTNIYFNPPGAVAERYVDDLYLILLDDVTLTVTPASAANSLEGTGIRADGYDLLSTPTAGEMAYNWWYAEVFITPRHSDATVGLFGIATPCWIELRYNAANTLLLDWSAANTLRLRVITGGVTYTATWATGGGAVLAGTKYLIKIEQYYGEYRVFVGGVQRITIPGVPAFPFVPNIAYWGMDNARAYNSDIVVSSY